MDKTKIYETKPYPFMSQVTAMTDESAKKESHLRVSLKYRNIIVEIISALFIFLFTYAALSKLLDYKTFKFQLGRSPFITNWAAIVAFLLPASELIISLLLIFKRTRLIGLYASFFLMLLFSGYIFVMLKFSYYLPCSCGGVLSMMSWSEHLVFNIIFTIIALITVLIYKPIKATI